MALKPGNTLSNGRYRIIKPLARGGFGFVYLAQDTLMDEEVAIKELIPALIDDETILKRFITEAKAAMHLRHPNVVVTYNVFADGENYYLVMEYMPGGSLEDLLRRREKLEIAQALRIMTDICDGLAYAHDIGVIHCDIKPANVLFAADGTAKLTDFGIAYISPELISRSWRTPRDFAAGTLLYMAPEQVDGVRDDPRLDIYALGAMLYQMLTGSPYLDFDLRETPGAQADNVNRSRHQMPVPPRTVNPAIPKWLEDVVLKALAKKPGSRYQSVEQMVKAMEGIGEKEEPEPRTVRIAKPVGPPPSSKVAGALDSIRSSRLAPIAGGIAIAAVLLAIGLSWALVFGKPAMPVVIPSPTAPVLEASPTKPAFTPTASRPAATPTPEPVMPTSTVVPRPTPTSAEPQTFDTDAQKGPIRYTLKDGMGLATQASIFGVEDTWEERVRWAQEIAARHPEILVEPGNMNAQKRGSSIVVEPLNFGYMIGGRVEHFSREDFTAGFDLVLSSSKRYRIAFPDPESVRRQPAPLRNGDIVRVFGYPREDAVLEVALVNRYVKEGGRWQNWYFAPAQEGKRLWVYGKLNEWGLGGVEEAKQLLSSDYDRAVAAYGFWQRSCPECDTITFWMVEVYFWSEAERLYTK